MKKRIIISLLVLALVAAVVCGFIIANAETDGIYTYKISNGEIEITGFKKEIRGAIAIPADFDGIPVTSIGDGAFFDCIQLESIVIPESVKKIGAWAFSMCGKLKRIEIPSSVTSIGNGAFSWCEKLESVNVPSGVTTIGTWAFAFCDSLKTVDIPSSVTTIGKDAFISCKGLTSINVASGNTKFISVNGSLYTKDTTQLLAYSLGTEKRFMCLRKV